MPRRGRMRDGPPYTSSDPGAAHPRHTISHRYARAGVIVRPRLDVTYRGRYRVGDGPWEPIPETRMITGTPQELSVLEAAPVLVR